MSVEKIGFYYLSGNSVPISFSVFPKTNFKTFRNKNSKKSSMEILKIVF